MSKTEFDIYDIYIIDLKTADMIRLPMLPEKINVEAGTRFASYDIMNIGEIKIPLGEELTVFSWDGILPGKTKKEEPYIRMWTDPQSIQEKWSHYRFTGARLQLVVTGTPINHFVYLDNYHVEYSGGFGDYTYSIQFSHLKDLKISTEPPENKAPQIPTVLPPSNMPKGRAGGKADGVIVAQKPLVMDYRGKEKAKINRPSKPEKGFYIVRTGDNLWKIAENELGLGSRYGEIAVLNGILNPHELSVGQKLHLPKR